MAVAFCEVFVQGVWMVRKENLSGGIDVSAALEQENQRIDGRAADALRPCARPDQRMRCV